MSPIPIQPLSIYPHCIVKSVKKTRPINEYFQVFIASLNSDAECVGKQMKKQTERAKQKKNGI